MNNSNSVKKLKQLPQSTKNILKKITIKQQATKVVKQTPEFVKLENDLSETDFERDENDIDLGKQVLFSRQNNTISPLRNKDHD